MRNIFIALILIAVPLAAISQSEDQKILKVFYRSDCPPCVQEMTIIPKIAIKNSGLKIDVLSFDENLTEKRLSPTLPPNVHIITMPGKEKEVFSKYGDTRMALPFSVLLNKDGLCRKHYGLVGTELIKIWMESC